MMGAIVYGIRDKRAPAICMYVGSTAKLMCVRFAEHQLVAYYAKKTTRNPAPIHHHMLDEGISNFEAYFIEECTCAEAKRREQFHMDAKKPTFNQMRAFGLRVGPRKKRRGLTMAQRIQVNFMRRAWYSHNKEKMKAKRAKRYIDIERAVLAEKVQCACGVWVARASMNRHIKSKKHKALSTHIL